MRTNHKFNYKPSNKTNPKDFVFGINAVSETLKAQKEVDKILIQKEIAHSENLQSIIREALDLGIPFSKVPLAKLNKITRKNHQGVIAFISAVFYVPLTNIIPQIYEEGKTPAILVLDSITDVRNFGAIARTAECAGIQAIVIPKKGAAQINSEAMKTSSGALNYISVCREENLGTSIRFLQESGLQIIACTEKTEESIYDIDFTVPTAIIMGSEGTGISDNLLRKSDKKGRIDLLGKIDSLNVSVAAGIVVYEMLRQRRI